MVSFFCIVDWDTFVDGHAYGHVLQTARWGRLKRSHGWADAQVAHSGADGSIVGGANVLYRRLPPGLGRLAYTPRGPVCTWLDVAGTRSTLAHIERAARAAGAIALLIEPSLPDSDETRALLAGHGYVPAAFAIQPRASVLVDVAAPDEKQILARMKEKWRYNIRLAARKGVTVRRAGSGEVDRFYDNYELTSTRKEFGIHSREYYRDMLRIFADGDSAPATLLLAEHPDHPNRALAGLVVTAVAGSGTYLYGASGNTGRELMPTYALQWAAMQWCRERHCHTYDLWGVPDEDEATLEANFESRNDGMWGVYRTKRGYGGRWTRYAGVWVKVFSPLRWQVFEALRKWRKQSVG